MASIQVLERKIHKHMKENADHFKHFTNELELLKTIPKSKVQRPTTELAKTKDVPKVKKLSDLVKNPTSTAASKKATVQNRHNDDDEMAKKKFYGRATSQSSGASQFSDAETEMTTIDFNGSPLVIKCSPLKVLQFLILDLQHKIKAFVPDDDKDISRNFKDINFAIKQARFNLKVDELATNPTMKSQATQVKIEQKVMKSTHQPISKAAQTLVYGDDVEKLEKFHDKYLKSQLDLDVDLRQVEDAFKLELSKSDDKIVGLKSEISLLQEKLNDERTEKALKLEEIRGEIKFIMGVIGETRNHDLIDNMHKKLAQTNKKLNDVKRKCLEATKQCLKVQLQNLVDKPTTPKENEVGFELGVIKSDVLRAIATLKSASPDFDEKHHRHQKKLSSLVSSSSASPNCKVDKVSSESIKSPSKWKEKKAEISFDDKYSTVIGDGKKSRNEIFDERNLLMMKQEINNSSRQTCHNSSSDSNDSVGNTFEGKLSRLQDGSLN